MLDCPRHISQRVRWKADWRKAKQGLVYRRKVERLTPYGPWAIPGYIVACESHGDWNAYNPSGAVGPYQLLGWGAPFPVTSRADKLAHHRIAGELWSGGAGAGNWVCA